MAEGIDKIRQLARELALLNTRLKRHPTEQSNALRSKMEARRLAQWSTDVPGEDAISISDAENMKARSVLTNLERMRAHLAGVGASLDADCKALSKKLVAYQAAVDCFLIDASAAGLNVSMVGRDDWHGGVVDQIQNGQGALIANFLPSFDAMTDSVVLA